MNIVLLEPEIPQNAGNISRTCAVTGASLHMIRPLGFSVEDKYLKRAGLDYWQYLDLHYYDNYEELIEKNPNARIFYATTKAEKRYCDAKFLPDDFIMFGKESAGIPEEILSGHKEYCIRIPMQGNVRSLNLSNSVAVILYEALRQMDFPDLESKGSLHRLEWAE